MSKARKLVGGDNMISVSLKESIDIVSCPVYGTAIVMRISKPNQRWKATKWDQK